MSGQSDTETNLLPDLYNGFVRIQFQIICFLFSEKYANFIHIHGTTDYKAHDVHDFRKSFTVTL